MNRLTDELANAEAYQHAYDRLYEQVGFLITRNQIAEEEAERISKLNAEILGHHNPAQRILYVDRIRTELADAKMVSPVVKWLISAYLTRAFTENCGVDTGARRPHGAKWRAGTRTISV